MFNLGASNPKDVELEATVSLAIHDLATNVHVSAEEGHVILSGRVGDFAAKREIDNIVQGVAGVKNLSNGMQITPIVD